MGKGSALHQLPFAYLVTDSGSLRSSTVSSDAFDQYFMFYAGSCEHYNGERPESAGDVPAGVVG